MRELPTGTVTFLFTDIEGSTRLLDELGAERYAAELAEHRRVLRDAFARHGGVEVDTQGDAFFVAFPTAPGALAAARQAQETLTLPVRMGLHTGTPLLAEESYVGPDVHRAARIAAAAHGGQVLVSASTASLLDTSNSLLLDLGKHRLKDVDSAARLFQLGAESFPPLRTLNNSNLPLAPTQMVGRETELSCVLRLLTRDGARLVTVIGPGGVGKTRFALEVAHELVEEFAHGVWFSDLAPLRDPALVAATIAAGLGAKTDLAEHISDKELLLVLDNFEHVSDAASDMAELLRRCPNVRMLVTGRERLYISGEQAYPLAPLPEAPAVELLRSRAEASTPGFDAPFSTLAAIAERIDRLPLALELAAARFASLAPDELLRRLDHRLRLLTSRARDIPERQRTLHATIEWSYELLGERERQLFEELSVFAGGCTLDAAEEVCGANVDTLESLVTRHLLRHNDGRYSMFETIGEFARQRLESGGSAEACRERHALYYFDVARAFDADWDRGAEELVWLRRLDAERDNIRAALEWLHTSGRNAVLTEFVDCLYSYWAARASAGEARLWLDRAVEVASEGLTQRKLVAAAAHVAGRQGDYEAALESFERALGLNRAADDKFGIAICLHARAGVVANFDPAAADRLLHEAASHFEELGEERRRASVLHDRGLLALMQGDTARARELIEREIAARGAGVGTQFALANARTDLALIAFIEGRDEEASRLAREALVLALDLGDRPNVADGLAWVAGLLQRRGDLDAAARAAAAAERLRAEIGLLWPSYAQDLYDTIVASGRLRPTAWNEGSSFSTEEAVNFALANLD